MKYKLREYTEFWRQTERGGIVLSVGGEFGTESDKRSERIKNEK